MADPTRSFPISTLRSGDEFDRDVFRTALSRFASGVTIVGSLLDGEKRGMTVSAFSSIALEPQLVMVALTDSKDTARAVRSSGWFVVNVLRADQRHVADRFAWDDETERYDGVDWYAGPEGLPVLSDCLATFVCRVRSIHGGGDHLVIIGEAVAGEVDDGEPLIYSQGAYRRLAAEDPDQAGP